MTLNPDIKTKFLETYNAYIEKGIMNKIGQCKAIGKISVNMLAKRFGINVGTAREWIYQTRRKRK